MVDVKLVYEFVQLTSAQNVVAACGEQQHVRRYEIEPELARENDVAKRITHLSEIDDWISLLEIVDQGPRQARQVRNLEPRIAFRNDRKLALVPGTGSAAAPNIFLLQKLCWHRRAADPPATRSARRW